MTFIWIQCYIPFIVKLVSGRILFVDVGIITGLEATTSLIAVFMDSDFRAVRMLPRFINAVVFCFRKAGTIQHQTRSGNAPSLQSRKV